jgi:hypothetical protein
MENAKKAENETGIVIGGAGITMFVISMITNLSGYDTFGLGFQGWLKTSVIICLIFGIFSAITRKKASLAILDFVTGPLLAFATIYAFYFYFYCLFPSRSTFARIEFILPMILAFTPVCLLYFEILKRIK